jgi:hypothetical protein
MAIQQILLADSPMAELVLLGTIASVLKILLSTNRIFLFRDNVIINVIKTM